ncbi:OLC1v1011780C1 [Oldenlandia corymbosa var. corymbosa]|uniref:OLC1v1011780C1 n=1 Tax=Oldenlandia corymbosa var. corymbosa TaxID=529605 RepID=A0AAV1DXH0_OLDCO|nr:OLC1v1011780C1 [Oldenlandia corymbosa var. corymbosa]
MWNSDMMMTSSEFKYEEYIGSVSKPPNKSNTSIIGLFSMSPLLINQFAPANNNNNNIIINRGEEKKYRKDGDDAVEEKKRKKRENNKKAWRKAQEKQRARKTQLESEIENI